MDKYNHKIIEPKWQKYWEKNQLAKAIDGDKKPKFYGLIEFPYPSGEGLHVGHIRSNTAMDIICRKRRMQGYNVLYPIGWDAFGLPTENYAIKTGIHPTIVTKKNTDTFRRQLKELGFSFDWDREINTTDPAYYKWTQWIFMQFLKKGLAYKKKMAINWCPSCKIGLANEEVVDGNCERCGTPVEKKEKDQWLLAITKYADRLDRDLDNHVDDKQKSNFLLLHGYTGGADKRFFPWLKAELEKHGYKVQCPQLPNPDDPKEAEQVEYIFKNCIINEDTILVGHSLGGVVAMKVLQKYGKPIKGLVLIAPALEPKFHKVEHKIFWGHFSWDDINYENLQHLAGYRLILSDLTETHRIKYLEYLAPKIKAKLVSGNAEAKHFRAAQEPLILENLLSLAGNLNSKKILIGTRNEAKVKMIKACLAGVKGIELVSLNDLPPVDDSALVEGDDFKENARRKSEFYFKKTGLPTISTDHMLWIEKWLENGGFMVHIRKQANPKSPRATDREVITFLKNFLKTAGGQSRANFHYALAYTDEEGTIDADEVPCNYILQAEEAKQYWPGYPTEALLKDEKTGLYKSEQPDEVRYIKIRKVLSEKFVPRMLSSRTPIDYLEKIKVQQKNWIGKKEGINITYSIERAKETVTVFTTRPDTNYGATFVVLAPENELVEKITLADKKKEVAEYVKKARSKSEEERIAEGRKKTGAFTGRYAINHLTGKKMPIWVSDFVLAGFGTGAVVGVPGHDIRDFEFAKEFRLEIIRVVVGKDGDASPIEKPEQVQEEEGKMVNSGILNGLEIHDATKKIMDYMEEKGWGKRVTTFHLRDWVFSRQHYWGEPIPVVFCENCAKEKHFILLVHGLSGHSKENWFPWFKETFSKRGYEVIIPDLPDADEPKLEKWALALEKAIGGKKGKISVIGHSLGAPAICQFLIKNKLQVENFILVAPTGKSQGAKQWDNLRKAGISDKGVETIKNFNGKNINLGIIVNLSNRRIIYFSDNDPYIPLEVKNDYAALKAEVITLNNKGHFNEGAGILEFSEISKEFPEYLNSGVVPVPEKDLPVELPKVEKYQPTDTGESPLAAMTDWVNVKCPKCGGPAKRETDTMPNWAGSSWYYLRYIDPKNKKAFADFKKLEYWTPVNWYNGGMEHTTLHLLYSRFWHKFLFDLGVVPTSEPYAKRTSHGLILAEGGVKMSKSKGNVINPDEIVKKFGADALRVYEMFMGPFDQAIAWSTDGLSGAKRFLEKIFDLYSNAKLVDCGGGAEPCESASKGLPQMLHKTIKKVGEDIEAMKFNTAISQMMIFMNFAVKFDSLPRAAAEKFLIILAPFAPHLAEELWQNLGHKQSIFKEKWPEYNPELVKDETINLVIQVNSKVRDTLEVSADISEEEAKRIAQESEKIKKWLAGKEVIKVIFVKGKLVNIVV